VHPARDLHLVSNLKEQGQRLDQVEAGILDRQALACNVQFRTEGNEAVILPFDNSCQSPGTLHGFSLAEDASNSQVISTFSMIEAWLQGFRASGRRTTIPEYEN
jgi:hypothetical protein